MFMYINDGSQETLIKMPYYACVKVNTNFKRLFTILGMSLANIHISEIKNSKEKFLGLIIGESYHRAIDAYYNVVIIIKEIAKETVHMELFVIGGRPLENLHSILKEASMDILKMLERQKISYKIEEENIHYFRELVD